MMMIVMNLSALARIFKCFQHTSVILVMTMMMFLMRRWVINIGGQD